MNITVKQLIIRNTKLYFKDKSTFLTSLITPLVLLVLFVTFLGRVYEESFLSIIPQGVNIPESLVNAFTNGWLLSSLIGVSCITIAFCSNIIMVQDKINGARNDLLAAPVKKSVLAVSYFISNYISTLLVCLAVAAVGFIYLGFTGWYFSASDIVFIVLDILLSCLFGASLAALIDGFLSTQGGVGAVSTLVSALYGFICGAYMPISQFSTGVRRF
ncbi:MAG: ABC transporter permease, partial [Acutalibacteraceae bacterium]